MKADPKKKFMDHFAGSLKSDSFVKATFGNYRGTDAQMQRLLVRRIATKKGIRLSLLFRRDNRDTVKNFDEHAALALLEDSLGSEFLSGHLFTTTADFQLDRKSTGDFVVHESKPTFRAAPSLDHDRTKKRPVDEASPYLKALSITTDEGRVYKNRFAKWKQINKFVEILAKRLDESGLSKKQSLSMVDMGCGKGYLTFAAYDFIKNTLGMDSPEVTGVDENEELTVFCNEVAASCGFKGLRFVTGSVSHQEVETDILVALHACDTATDDAIYKGIAAGASLILVSPCCHKELRPKITVPSEFVDMLAHGTLLDRQAELITDGLRSLILQERGYETRVFEFVPTSHTPKNHMISAVKSSRAYDANRYREQIDKIKSIYNIDKLRLETMLLNLPR